MDFTTAVRTCFSKYATFTGRARRSEFWWFALFTFAGSLVLQFLDGLLFGSTAAGQSVSLLSAVFALAVILPGIAVAVRRLHDLDRTGWWYLLVLVPVIGVLILLYFFVQRGTDGPNQYGDDPLSGAEDYTAA